MQRYVVKAKPPACAPPGGVGGSKKRKATKCGLAFSRSTGTGWRPCWRSCRTAWEVSARPPTWDTASMVRLTPHLWLSL